MKGVGWRIDLDAIDTNAKAVVRVVTSDFDVTFDGSQPSDTEMLPLPISI